MDQQPEQSPKCSQCSGLILEGEMAVRGQGDWLHLRCADVSPGVRETPAIRCVACRRGIARVGDLVMTPAGPTHARCGGAQPS